MYEKIFMTAVLILLTAASLFPFDSAAGESTGSTFSLNVVLDTSIIASAAGLNGTIIYFDKVEKVNHSDFDGNIYDPIQVNSFDKLLMNPHSMVVDDIGTMYTQTIALTYGAREIGKLCINRARPFMYYNSYPQQAVDDCDWNKPFPSGHTTLAFAGAVFTGYVFNEYFPDSKWKIPITGA